MSDTNDSQPKPRKRSLTELTLGWLAERLRKTDDIKEAIKDGSYQPDSRKIAESIVKDES